MSPDLLAAGHRFVNIHAGNEYAFEIACENSQWNVVQFLVFDLNLEKNPKIGEIIRNYPQAGAYFEAREERQGCKKMLDRHHLKGKDVELRGYRKSSDSNLSYRVILSLRLIRGDNMGFLRLKANVV